MQIGMFDSDFDEKQSPEISAPEDLNRRLIDEGMMHYEASLSGLSERYTKGKTSHTIHVWWARRPHSAMRALTFASLCKDRSPDAQNTLEALGSRPVPSPDIVDVACGELEEQYGADPKVLDMFGGGGTIPFEACRLGANAYACDVNELSAFIQRCILEYSQGFEEGELPRLIRSSGNRVLQQLKEESSPLFPLRDENVFGYLWTYSIECTHCGYRFYLSKRRWLSKKKDKNLAFVFEEGEEGQSVAIEDLDQSGRLSTAMGRSKATCPKCGSDHDDLSIKEAKDEQIGLIKLAEPTGKEFHLSKENAVPTADLISDIEKSTLNELGIDLPNSELPEWSGVVNPALYGVDTHSDFLNPRQRAVLLLLIKAIRDEYSRLRDEKNTDEAKCVVGFLTGLIDQVVDWNCRLSMWISQNEQVGRAFSGPGVAMLWDYAETDQLMNGPANLWSKLDRIAKGAESIPQFQGQADVVKAPAQDLPYDDDTFDAIVTDPPYYDNIFYSILSDFFYSWKKPLLNVLEESEDWSITTDFSNELVASSQRSGSSKKAHEDYCQELTKALKEAQRVLSPDGVFSFIYSHNSLLGWEAIIRAYRQTNLEISSAQPLSIERRQRPRAMTSKAKDTCIAFVSRESSGSGTPVELKKLKDDLESRLIEFGQNLVSAGWEDDDAGLAVFANCVGYIANSSGVKNMSDADALKDLSQNIRNQFPGFDLSDRKSL